MRTVFNLPSCDYNIILSKEDLQELLEKGYITVRSCRIPCSTSRALWDTEKEKWIFDDRKTIPNNLFFGLSEPVADLHAGDRGVKFLNIALDETCKKE